MPFMLSWKTLGVALVLVTLALVTVFGAPDSAAQNRDKTLVWLATYR